MRNSFKHFGLLALIFFLTIFSSSAQQTANSIKGKIVDSTGQALAGVVISVKGARTSTVSANDGSYAISAPNGSTLVFEHVGYDDIEIKVAPAAVYDISMNPTIAALDDVVVIGYGTVRKSDLTGSISQVKGADINSYPAANLMQALNGRAAGVQVLQNTGAPGAAISVRVRGTNSIQGSNEPLYVVDGFPIGGNPTMLNNADIESVEILKDASATAIYGSRGANGVVLITTRKGKAGKTTVDVETSYGIQELRKKLDLMNATEYAQFYNEQAANDAAPQRFTQAQIDALGEGFDWQDFVFHHAPMSSHSVTVNGGNEKTKFSLTGSVFNQDGIIRNSSYDRYSLRLALNHEISKKFSTSVNVNLGHVRNNAQNSNGVNRGFSLIDGTLVAFPTVNPYNDDGTYRILGTTYPWGSATLRNPINYVNEMSDITKANNVLANASVSYKVIPDLVLKVMGGLENSDNRNDNYTSRKFLSSTGSASVSATQSYSLLNENTATYTKSFGKHNLSVLAGFTYQLFQSTSLNGSGSGFLSDATETAALSSAATAGIPGSGYTSSLILSYLGRINYSWNNKYLATLSMRYDGSSRYSEDSKWGSFPSAAVTWRVSEEEFMKNVGFISDLRLRATWGLTGSQAISPYATLNLLNAGRAVFGDALYTSLAPSTRLPGQLKWETTEQADFGLDAGFLNNRIRFTAEFYRKTTRDLLNTVSLPSSFGYTSTIQNIGSIRNQGFEFSTNATVIKSPFTWDLGGIISVNRNKVVKLYGGKDVFGSTVTLSIVNDIVNILREGKPLGSFYGYQEDGYDATGRIVFKDLDGNGSITQNDRTIIGNPTPDFTYGINSRMEFKNFELSLFIQGSQGNDIFNVSSINNTLDYGFGLNMPRDVYLNHWTPGKTDAKYPILSRTLAVRMSDRFVEDGSYIRLKNIQLAYNIPGKTLKAAWIRNLQLYVSGQNVWTSTKYSWWDPEVNSNGGANSINQGLDYHTYPTAKTLTFGLRAGF